MIRRLSRPALSKLARPGWLAASLVAALVGGGFAYAATAGTPTASKTDTIATTAAGKSISATGGVTTTIERLKLPPGPWVLHAAGDLVNFGPSDYTRCAIVVGSTQIAATATLVGNPNSTGEEGPAGLLASYALTGGAVNNSVGTVLATLRCSHDHTNGATPYVDANASLWAHKTSGLKTVTE